ncbi:MAG: hypothetical protein CMJ31_02700 [Phycisphaerae bacterium]|nr:hypothetical protein [Phycisphaerae bacterium]
MIESRSLRSEPSYIAATPPPSFAATPDRISSTEPGVSYDHIARRALILWHGVGRPEGRDDEIWAIARACCEARARLIEALKEELGPAAIPDTLQP